MAMEGTDQAIASLMPATAYALAENVESFLARDILGAIADKPRMQNRSYYTIWGSYGILWFNLAAHLYNEPEYLRSVIAKYGSMVKAYRFPARTVRELGRSFWDGNLPPDIPSDKTRDRWVMARPVSRLYHEKAVVHGPKNVPYDKAFDFLVFRDPQGKERQYLHLNGQNAGSYSTDSGNAITEFYSHGRGWISSGIWVMQTTRHLTSVAIVRDGDSQRTPPFVKLERVESTLEWGITRTGYVDYNGTDWYRNIINVPNKWFLVIDEIGVKEPGDYVLESRWLIAPCSTFDGDDLLACQSGPGERGYLYFRLAGNGWQTQYTAPRLYRKFLNSPIYPFPRTAKDISRSGYFKTELARRWTGHMKKDDTHVFSNLFYVDESRKPIYRLQELEHGGYLVTGEQESWIVRVDKEGKWVVEPVGDQELQVQMQKAKAASPALDLKPKWQQTESARILSSAVLSVDQGSRYAVGLADGRIRLRNEQGGITAEARMSGKVYALCAVDLDGDGNDEVIAGTVTGTVCAFRADGSRLWIWNHPEWKRPDGARVGWGNYRPVVTGILPVNRDKDKTPEILVMGICWYVLDSKGRTLFAHEVRNSGTCWHGIVREKTFILAVGDLMGDEADEIVGDYYGIGGGGGCNIVHVWDGKQDEYIWRHSKPGNRFCGDTLRAVLVADFDGDGKDEFATASDAYVLQLGYYDNFGPRKQCIWACGVGSGINAMIGADLDGNGKIEIVVGTEMGQVQAFDYNPPSNLYDKERLFITDAEQGVMALAARQRHDGNGEEVWVGTVNGKILVLDAEGNIVRRGHLPGLIDHIVVSADGAVLATTSGGQVALYE